MFVMTHNYSHTASCKICRYRKSRSNNNGVYGRNRVISNDIFTVMAAISYEPTGVCEISFYINSFLLFNCSAIAKLHQRITR